MNLTSRLSLLCTLLFLSSPAQPNSLKLQLVAEEPTGVFYDRDTLGPQTPLLFTAHVENPSPQTRQVTLTWRVTDAAGKTRWERGAKFEIGPNTSIVRRELFDAPARGGFLLEANAFAKQKGPDVSARAALPFAILIAPAPESTAGARPQSFFVLGTPSLLSERDLDFYGRIGARVLRSPLPPDPAQPDWAAVESQLSSRLRRNIASIALLPLGKGDQRANEAFFARQVPATLARYESLTTWELSGDVSPADLDAWSQIARSRRSEVTLLGPVPSGLNMGLPANATIRLRALDGATFEWPPQGAHPAALRRLWLSRGLAARSAGVTAVHLRRESAIPASNALEAAGDMTGDFITAVMAGSASLSEPLDPPTTAADAGAMARGAAFAMLTRTLEDASFREELFPRSPALEGALFRSARGSIATVWTPLGSGTMTARVSPARAFDIFGNPLSTDRKGAVQIPLTGQPVYVLADVPTDVLAFALRNAQLTDVPSLEARILPLSRRPGVETPGNAAVRVRLQNVGLGSQNGQIHLDPPSGWKLVRDRYDFQLNEGESKTYEFRVTRSTLPKTGSDYAMTVTAGKQSWKQDVRVASATNVARGEVLRLDGDLSDWGEPAWMEAGNKGGVEAKVALKWDANRLFIAAQVHESALNARRADESAYEFWNGHDALQIAFGTGSGPETVPGREPFRDSDRGFLLCPFNQKGPNDFDGRLLRLWSPEKPYGTINDHIRWGGAVPGAACVIRRDEKAGITTYEARLPLSALPEIQPLALAAKDSVVRFGWLLHNDEGAPLDWGRVAGNFRWWDNTSTFLPEGDLTSSLRSTLGFTQSGDVDLGLEPVAPRPLAPTTAPAPRRVSPPVRPPAPVTPQRNAPPQLPPFLIEPTPPASAAPEQPAEEEAPAAITPARAGSKATPPLLMPMPIRMLPPAAPPRGRSIPPSSRN